MSDPVYLPEATIAYRTWIKQTFVDALQPVFRNHPDKVLQHTKIGIEYPRTQADYPSIVVKYKEQDIHNAGVGHSETFLFAGETLGHEFSVTLDQPGTISLFWPVVPNATSYRVYRGTASERAHAFYEVATNNYLDENAGAHIGAPPDISTAAVDMPEVTGLANPGVTFHALAAGTYFYIVTALIPDQAVKFGHYFYHGNIEFDVYALSVYDRDLLADALVQIIAMGVMEAYTQSFLDRIYPDSALFPHAQFHFININTDQITPLGDTEVSSPWGGEDDLLYQTGYTTNLFGELYSLPPQLTYGIVRKVLLYPMMEGFVTAQDLPPDSITGWVPAQ